MPGCDFMSVQKNKSRVLFVDDEPQVLKLLQIMLKPMSSEWDMVFAESGEQALKLFAQCPFDVVVSDMRMPGINGAQLLNEVMRRHPETVRLILSGYADEDLVMQCVGATHQYLAKPCELSVLRSTLQRIQKMRETVSSAPVKAAIQRMTCLPSVPAVYFQILEALQSPSASSHLIGEIVSHDPSLTSKLLQMVNSAFFGFNSRVDNAEEAVRLLGVGRIRSLALSLHIFAAFDEIKFKYFSVNDLWYHSLQTGFFARDIVTWEGGNESMAEQAFTAGVLHDAGQLLLAAYLPDEYRVILEGAKSGETTLAEAELSVLKTTHAEVGAYLFELWGLPMPLVEAVAFHLKPRVPGDPQFGPLAAVHVANALAHEKSDAKKKMKYSQLDLGYLEGLGLKDRLEGWRTKLQNS